MHFQIQTFRFRDRKQARIKPNRHFMKCPTCGCIGLISVGPDVLCSNCDWDSTAWDVSRGAMDNLFRAIREFRFAPQQRDLTLNPFTTIAAVSHAEDQITLEAEGA